MLRLREKWNQSQAGFFMKKLNLKPATVGNSFQPGGEKNRLGLTQTGWLNHGNQQVAEKIQ